MSDPTSSTFDQAMAAFGAIDGSGDSPESAPAPVAPTLVSAPPVVEAAPTAVVPAPVTELQPLDVPPDTPIRIKVNGVEKIVKASDYPEMLQRTDVFTQRQQAVAKQQRDLEAHYVQKEAHLQAQAQQLHQLYQQVQQQGDPVARLAQHLTQQQQPVVNDAEIATIGEVKHAVQALYRQQQQELAQVRQEAQQSVLQSKEQAKQEAKMDAALAQDQQRVSATVTKLLDTEDGKMLRAINPEAEAIIRFNAMQMGPENVDQAVEYLNQFTKDWVSKVRGHFTQQQTSAAVTTAKTLMEPPSGAAPTLTQPPKAPSLKKDGSIDWAALREQALSLLE